MRFKTKFLFLTFFASCSLLVNAQRYLSTSSYEETSQKPSQMMVRTVETVSDGVIVTYKINAVSLSSTDDGSVRVSLDGFGGGTTLGEPALPSRSDAFCVPSGYRASVQVVASTYHDYQYSVASCVPAISDNDSISALSFSTALNSYTGFKPSTSVAVASSDLYRGREIANVTVSPIQYNMIANTLRVYDMLQYKVTYSKAKSARALIGTTDTTRVIGSFILPDSLAFKNPELVPFEPIVSTRDSVGYLIVTVPRYESYLKKFVQWKKLLGFNVDVKISEDWNSESIKSAVQSSYDSNKTLLYVLFVGDNTQVPGQLISASTGEGTETETSLASHYTDRYYCCIDGDEDTMPDLYYGRWAVSNEEELERVIDKTIQYEQQPTTDEKFYKTLLNCSYFEANSESHGKKYESKRFIHTSEDVYDYMTNQQNKTVDRIYWHTMSDIGEFPELLYYNPKYNNGLQQIPESAYDIIKQKGNFNQFVDSINDGRFLTFYKAHGQKDQLVTFIDDSLALYRFNVSRVNKLDNCGWPTVLFSMTCETGQFDYSPKCFAQSMLDQTDGGAIGVIAASQSSYTPYSDALSFGLFNSIWPSPGFSTSWDTIEIGSTNSSATPVYRLGQILENSKQMMSQQFSNMPNFMKYMNEVYHCFGDPGLILTTDVPTEFTGYTVKREDTYVSVSLPLATKANIAFYDQTSNTVSRYYGNYAKFTTTTPDNVSITISGHNKIPYVEYGEDYTPDGVSLTERTNRIISVTNNSGVVNVKFALDDTISAATILAVDLLTNRICAEVPCSLSGDNVVGMHIGYGYYAISLMIDGYPYDTVRTVISR